jgi:large subunit ribosomal protein L10
MPNALNVAIEAEYTRLLGEHADALVVQPVGMSVADANAFRTKLAEHKLRMQVVRGNLAQRVLEARGLSNLGPLFSGPSAFITAEGESSADSAIAAAKVVSEWRKKTGAELPAVKGGLLEGKLLDAGTALSLAKMPGRRELLATVAGQIVAPGRKLAGQLVAGGGRIAGAVKTRIEQLEKTDQLSAASPAA